MKYLNTYEEISQVYKYIIISRSDWNNVFMIDVESYNDSRIYYKKYYYYNEKKIKTGDIEKTQHYKIDMLTILYKTNDKEKCFNKLKMLSDVNKYNLL